MKIKVTICIISCLIVFFFCGCFGETDCPKYPVSKITWIPYKKGDMIRFSDHNDTIEFTIEETFITEAYSFKNNCKCACEATALFKTSINSDIDIKLEGLSHFYGNNTSYQYIFINYGGDYYSPLRSDEFYFSEAIGDIPGNIIAEYQVDNTTYQNVLEIKLDTIDNNGLIWNKPEIWRLVIANSIGIIQFEDCKSKKIWSRIE